MFVVIVRYKAPLTAIDAALPDHRLWLDRGYGEGVFLLAGPQEPRSGGVILAHNTTRAELLIRLAEDPFQRQGLADYDVIEMIARKADPRLDFLLG